MKANKIVIVSLILLFFGTASFASAATDNSRYFVKSTSAFWKKSLGARHSFNNGFTADLTDWELRLTKMFGVDIEPVQKLNILASAAAKTSKNTGPTDNLGWGVRYLYNDPLATKTSGGKDVDVAVLDTGVTKDHPDLKDRIVDCKDFSSPANPLIDGKCADNNGHGTHVSGIIAADGGKDGKGIYGVAPEADLMEYKVCSDNGSCYSDDVAAAISAAVDNGANIINISLGSDTESPLIADAVSYATNNDVLVVAAAGNDGPYAGSLDYPAANPDVIGVGAFDSLGSIADWSARGDNEDSKPYVSEEKDIEFAAPGVNVESTWKNGGYAILSGTSMSAPHIAGLAAKLWQKDAKDPAAATRDILHKLSKDIMPAGDDNASGWGVPQLK